MSNAPEASGSPSAPHPEGRRIPIVAVGASAGGLAALRPFVGAIPPDSGAAYVILMHLDPEGESGLTGLLASWTAIPVMEVGAAREIEPDHVYVLSAGAQLRIEGERLLTEALPHRDPGMLVNRFFTTLAEARGPDAVGVVLSGTGRDGTLGCRAIREHGGLAAAQNPEEAAHPEMPRAAVEEGGANLVRPAAELLEEILRILREGPTRLGPQELSEDEESSIVRILARVGREVGHDLSYYKRPSLMRRLDRRMRFSRSTTIGEYAELIDHSRAERQELFRDLLISVSRFFRDPEAFAALEREVIPKLLDGKQRGDEVRVWVAGCATGEEAYSIAILLKERAAGMGSAPEIQVFATDLDVAALRFARRAVYPQSVGEHLGPDRLHRFFEPVDGDEGGCRVVASVRESVLFAVHGVLTDPPFSRLDLVSCRNLLIYLEPQAQEEAIERFHYALNPDGFLFLGSFESIGARRFRPLSREERIYRRIGGKGSIPKNRYRLGSGRIGRIAGEDPADRPARRREGDVSLGTLHGRLLQRYAPPSLVVDSEYTIVHLSDQAGRYLRHPAGSLTGDVRDLVKEPLDQELRLALYQAFRNRVSSTRTVEARIEGEPKIVTLTVEPGTGEDERFALLVFEEEPVRDGPSESEGDRPGEEAILDLQEDLRRIREQLLVETEERELTIEELQATNEELQSVNEELETRREELQSVNEELTTINQQHRATIDELAETNADLRNLMEATDVATLFLDDHLRIRRSTESAAILFHLLPSDEGRPFEHVAHRLREAGDLPEDARAVLASGRPIQKEARDLDGRWQLLRILPYRSGQGEVEGVVLTCFDITQRKRMEEEVRAATADAEEERARLLTLMEHMPAGIVIIDAVSRKVLSVNQRAREILWETGAPSVEGGRSDESTIRGLPGFSRWPVQQAIETGEPILDRELSLTLSGQRRRDLLVSAAPIAGGDGTVKECVLTVVDIAEVLRQARRMEAAAEEAKVSFIATISHEFRTPLNGIMGYTELMAEGIPDPPTDAQALSLQRVQACVRHLTFMVEQILVLSVLDAGDAAVVPARFEAGEVVRDAVLVILPEADEKGLVLRAELPEELGEVVTDRQRLEQVLTNLVQNAVKYTSDGGVVLSACPDREGITFEVRDTGIGIDPIHHERIFERFWQAREGRHPTGVKGTGVGLFVVKKLLEQLGGTVEVESRIGAGSTFRVWIPRVHRPTRPSSPAERGSRERARP